MSLDISVDGNYSVLCQGEGRCQVFNHARKESSFTFLAHRETNQTRAPYSVSFWPNKQFPGQFATVGQDGKLNFWDLLTKQRLKQVQSDV